MLKIPDQDLESIHLHRHRQDLAKAAARFNRRQICELTLCSRFFPVLIRSDPLS